jgi:hypothetical protein
MTEDDIVMLAKKAGFDAEVEDVFNYKPQYSFIGSYEDIQRFAALGAAAEREACARVAELVAREIDDTNGTATYIAKGIRARGQE